MSCRPRPCRCSKRLQGQLCLTLLFCSASVCAQQDKSPGVVSLDEAYRTELARLRFEELSIRKALRQAEVQTEKTRAALAAEIESLTVELTRLRADNAKQEGGLPEAERMHSMQEQQKSIERREIQIETWLETQGVPIALAATVAGNDTAHKHPPIDAMVSRALEYVQDHGQLRLESNQEYFGADGVALHGTILHIAKVGALVVDGDNLRPLELAADGSLRIAKHQPVATVSHGALRSVGTVLFDPDNIQPSREKKSGWRKWFGEGSIVMWSIAILGALAGLLFLERLMMFAIYLIRVLLAERRGFTTAVPAKSKLLRAIAVVQRADGSLEDIEGQAVEAVLQAQPVVRRGISLLGLVASVAPLLGLLGTVSGMIATFAVLNDHGTGNPQLLSGGISEALLSTQFGLMVAIPALLAQTALYRGGDVILRRVEAFALLGLHGRANLSQEQAAPKVVSPRSAS